MNWLELVVKFVNKKWNKMFNYVITGFDEKYWNLWGESWIISLKELAEFDLSNTIIIGYDLSENTKQKILGFGVRLVESNPTKNFRFETVKNICKLLKEQEEMNFAYWDADVYFQKNIDEIFKSGDKLLASKNCGFIGGNSHSIKVLDEFLKIIELTGQEKHFNENLIDYFSCLLQFVDSKYNFRNVKIDDQIVVHPNRIKDLTHRNVLFWERHKSLYSKHTKKRSNVPTLKLKPIFKSWL
jgi:hypothetical protein